MRRRESIVAISFVSYAEHLEKSKVYFATKVFEYIDRCNRTALRFRFSEGEARIYCGSLINAEHSLENNRFMIEAIGLNTLLWLCKRR